jgi:hypothetical protein
MNDQPFYFEIKDVMTQFLAAFNDIIISRHTRDRSVRSKIKVRYVYAPKQRVIHDLTNKARHLTLPVVAVNITGVSRDQNRVFNKLAGSYMPGAENYRGGTTDSKALTSYHIPQPVPVDVSVSMSILARYQTDVEQIISNFVPYSDPYIVISWKMPGQFTDREQEIRSEVIWDGNLNMSYPDQLSGTEPYRLSCDTSFVIKSWLFKQAVDPVKNAANFNTSLTPAVDIDLPMDEPAYNESTEGPFIQGEPGTSPSTNPIVTHIINGDKPFSTQELWGYNLGNVTSVYLSGAGINALSGQTVDNYDTGNYPAFTGVPVDFTITDENRLSIEVPLDTGLSEEVDVVLLNITGYGTSMKSSSHGRGVMLGHPNSSFPGILKMTLS